MTLLIYENGSFSKEENRSEEREFALLRSKLFSFKLILLKMTRCTEKHTDSHKNISLVKNGRPTKCINYA